MWYITDDRIKVKKLVKTFRMDNDKTFIHNKEKMRVVKKWLAETVCMYDLMTSGASLCQLQDGDCVVRGYDEFIRNKPHLEETGIDFSAPLKLTDVKKLWRVFDVDLGVVSRDKDKYCMISGGDGIYDGVNFRDDEIGPGIVLYPDDDKAPFTKIVSDQPITVVREKTEGLIVELRLDIEDIFSIRLLDHGSAMRIGRGIWLFPDQYDVEKDLRLFDLQDPAHLYIEYDEEKDQACCRLINQYINLFLHWKKEEGPVIWDIMHNHH